MAAQAATITYVTPPGATTSGGPVAASATFTTGDGGTLSITLTDSLANPNNVAQLLSDLDFTLSNGATVGSLFSSSGQQITINADGTFSLGSTGSTGWGLVNGFNGGLQLNALGFVGPTGLIIGPPGPGGTYSNANSSIAGNPAHNPFLNGTATFVIHGLTGVNADTTVTSATFSFGTTAGINVDGCPSTNPTCGGGGQSTPEPISLILTGSGLLGFFFLKRRSAAR